MRIASSQHNTCRDVQLSQEWVDVTLTLIKPISNEHQTDVVVPALNMQWFLMFPIFRRHSFKQVSFKHSFPKECSCDSCHYSEGQHWILVTVIVFERLLWHNRRAVISCNIRIICCVSQCCTKTHHQFAHQLVLMLWLMNVCYHK